jgi:hypothetical protein
MQRYSTMRLPVSILFGRGDRILDPHEHGEALAAELRGAQLTLIGGANVADYGTRAHGEIHPRCRSPHAGLTSAVAPIPGTRH